MATDRWPSLKQRPQDGHIFIIDDNEDRAAVLAKALDYCGPPVTDVLISGRYGSMTTGYTTDLIPLISPRDEEGLLQLLDASWSPCCRSKPRRSAPPRQPDCDGPCCLRGVIDRSASGVWMFRGQLTFTFVTAR